MNKTTIACVVIAACWIVSPSNPDLRGGVPVTPPATATASPTAAATTTTYAVPRVEDIRALIKSAIALRSDPEKAQALMVQACELVTKLPPGSDLTALAVDFDPAKDSLDHLMKPTASRMLEEKTKLSPHMELVEEYLSSTYPFVGMADNGKGFIFPTPMTDKVRRAQNVLRYGKTVYRVAVDNKTETRWKGYFVSPDEKHVVLQDWLRAKPTEVLEVDTGKRLIVDSPEIEGHENVEPFAFVRWNQDSQSFVVEVKGTYVKGPGAFLAYRELWQVQADTAKASRTKRQEQPWEEKLKWED